VLGRRCSCLKASVARTMMLTGSAPRFADARNPRRLGVRFVGAAFFGAHLRIVDWTDQIRMRVTVQKAFFGN